MTARILIRVGDLSAENTRRSASRKIEPCCGSAAECCNFVADIPAVIPPVSPCYAPCYFPLFSGQSIPDQGLTKPNLFFQFVVVVLRMGFPPAKSRGQPI